MPGHLAGIGVALCAATTVTVLRVLGPTEARITLMSVTMAVSLAVNGVLMLGDFHVPAATDFMWLTLAGLLAGFGHILLMGATKRAPANRIAPGQYVQILCAVVLGAMFFGEFPDGLAMVGLALVAVSGVFAFLGDGGGIGATPVTIVEGRTPRSGGRD